jgi:hypothetical protein
MGLFTEYFSETNFAVSSEIGSPKTGTSTKADNSIKRIQRTELEKLFVTDPQTFNTINVYSQTLLSAGYEIKAVKKTNQNEWDEFFENIGQIGLKMDLDQIMYSIVRDAPLYGYSYVERIYNRLQDKIVDLKMVDAKLMDYARNKDGVMIVDSEQNPIGFTMMVGYGAKVKGDPCPSEVNLGTDKIFLLSKRIACFRLFPFGNNFESMGIIEPAYESITRKLKIEEAAANSIYHTAAYPIYAVVGDSQRTASKTLMESTLSALQNLSHSRYMVFQHPTQLDTLKVENSPQVETLLQHMRTNQSSSSGIALGFTLGTGEAVNRSTLTTQQENMNVRMNSVGKIIASQFTKLILDEIYKVNKFSSKAVMKWGNVSVDDKEIKSNILFNAIEKGIIAPKEGRKLILKALDIEGDDSIFEEYFKEQKKKKISQSIYSPISKSIISKELPKVIN